MSRQEEFYHGTSMSSARSIKALGFKGMGDGDFGKGDYFTKQLDWAGDYAGFNDGDPSGAIVKAHITPKNPLIHSHGETPAHVIGPMLKKAKEIWPQDTEFHEKIRQGHEHAIAEMSGRMGYDAYVQPSGLLVTKAEGIATPKAIISRTQFEKLRHAEVNK